VDEKVGIALISVVMGWILAQVTDFFKKIFMSYFLSYKLKKGLLNELVDVKEQTHRIILMYARKLQIYAVRGVEPTASIPVYNMFFKQYYKDVFSYLNRDQRLSYQLIHGLLDALNKRNEDFINSTAEIYKLLKKTEENSEKLSLGDAWGDEVTSVFKMAKDLLWHVEYHLKNAKNPTLDISGPMHNSYIEFQKELDKDVKNIIEGAKKDLKKEDFE